MNRRERAVTDHVPEHVERVVANDSRVREFSPLNRIEQAAHARSVHLHGDEVHLGSRFGDGNRGLPHAGADLENQLARGSDLLGGEGDAVSGIQLLERALLRRCCPALAQDVTSNRPVQAAFGAIFPSVGVLGEAE